MAQTDSDLRPRAEVRLLFAVHLDPVSTEAVSNNFREALPLEKLSLSSAHHAGTCMEARYSSKVPNDEY